eukprot:Skav203818  [mRNA]  locus=scaffold505:46440:46844:- [translate_table: standard]
MGKKRSRSSSSSSDSSSSSSDKKKKKDKKKKEKKDKKKKEKKDKKDKKEKKKDKKEKKSEKSSAPLVMPTVPILGAAEERERLLRARGPGPAVASPPGGEAARFDQAKARLDALRAQQQRPEKSVGYTVRKPNW